jgi:hypothetical protein
VSRAPASEAAGVQAADEVDVSLGILAQHQAFLCALGLQRFEPLLRAGYLLRRHAQGRRSHLRADFLDTYSKLAFAQLYDRKTALVAADLLNDRVIPFCENIRSRCAGC